MFERNPPAIDLLVVDEAEHDAASSMAHLHNVIHTKWILGLTATPFRTDQVKLCFVKVVKPATRTGSGRRAGGERKPAAAPVDAIQLDAGGQSSNSNVVSDRVADCSRDRSSRIVGTAW
jgi:hypothetical protein